MHNIGMLAPNARVEHWPFDETTREQLAEGTLDLVVADDWSLRKVSRRELLLRDTFVCLVRSDHPRVGRRLTMKRFLAEQHALVSSRGRVAGNVDWALKTHGATRRVSLTVPHFLAVPAIVAETDLIVTLAGRVARGLATDGAVRTVKPPLELDGFNVSLAWHARMESDTAVTWLRETVAEACRPLR